MGRKERHDADYFPFYAKDGKTLFVLESKYDCKGTGFFTNLLRFLTLQPDHHFCIEDPGDRLYFFSKTKCDEESGLDMIEMMVKTGKLDSDLWNQRQVLASQDHLNSIQDAYKKRIIDCITIDEIKAFYQITSHGNTQASGFQAEEIHKQGDNYLRKYTKQSKVKQSKVKQSGNGKLPEEKNSPSNAADAGSANAADDSKKSKHFSQNTGEYFSEIEKVVQDILKLPHKPEAGGVVNWWAMVQEFTNARGHPKAILGTLKTIRGNWAGIKDVQAYVRRTFELKNSKENARDCERESERFKAELNNVNPEIKKLMQGIFSQ